MRLVAIMIFFCSSNLLAHQPKLINYSPSIDNPHQVIDPEISKAYYAMLTGEPHYYIINFFTVKAATREQLESNEKTNKKPDTTLQVAAPTCFSGAFPFKF